MAMPAHWLARAALAADLHLQVEVDRVEPPEEPLGQAHVQGRVRRCFKGPPDLMDRSIGFRVDVHRDSDPPRPRSGGPRSDYEAVRAARVIEAYLSRHGEGFEVAGYHSLILEALTHAPQLLVTEADAAEPPGPSASERAKEALGLSAAALFIGGGLAGLVYAIWLLLR